MKEESKKYFGIRSFLNDNPLTSAHVIASAELHHTDDLGYVSTENKLSIADCNRVVNLDVDFTCKEDFISVKAKVQRLRDVIDGLLRSMEDQWQDFDSLTKEGEELKKSQKEGPAL
jgi:hypothetical protein